MKARVGKTKIVSPGSHRLCLASECDQTIRPLVKQLFSVGGPAAILRAIRTVIVDTLYRVALTRACPHVQKKCLKRVSPTVTHCDATTAVVTPSRVTADRAATDHRTPHVVNRCFAHAVTPRSVALFLSLAASATARFSASQRRCVNRLRGAAFAETVPPLLASVTNSRPASEVLIAVINAFQRNHFIPLQAGN